MFDLKTELQKWRKKFSKHESTTLENSEELENHVLDSVDGLKERGLSEEEAFLVAKHRVGDVDKIAVENSKVNEDIIWKKRAVQLIGCWFLYDAFTYISVLLSPFVLLRTNILNSGVGELNKYFPSSFIISVLYIRHNAILQI